MEFHDILLMLWGFQGMENVLLLRERGPHWDLSPPFSLSLSLAFTL